MAFTHPTNPEERNMVKKVIDQTYKGILRVANNIDLIEGEKDEFLSPTYFAKDNTPYQRGLNEVHQFLTGGDENKRFASSDTYTTLKLPVTDSMGNYLNFSLGVNGSLIGSQESAGTIIEGSTQFDDSDTTTFAVLQSNNPIKVGLSERVNIPQKKVGGGSLSIDGGAKLTIKNNYHYDSETLKPVANGTNYRTIISVPETMRESDAFIYRQENYVKNGNNTDCIVTVESLKDYINSKIEHYLINNKAEVPSGTIISQYCSLDKWFCLNDENKVDDKTIWEGYRPAMYAGTGESGVYAAQNIIQNRAYKRSTYLYMNGLSTGELPPDFKRGYVLCNGDALNLKLVPSYVQNTEDAQDSIRLFFDLFYTIGYYYSKSGKMPEVKRVYKQNGKYRFKSRTDGNKVSHETQNWYYANVQPEISYGITMAAVLAFKAFEQKFKTSRTELTTADLAVNWLKGQKIPDDYIFNVVIPSNLTSSYPNNYFNYQNDSLSAEVKINIGREINSFDDKIPYYVYDGSKYTVELVSIWETAEAYHLAEMFIHHMGLAEWENFVYPFYLPQLYTVSDNDVNRAGAIRDKLDYKNPKQYAAGRFIGSNGLIAADSFTLNSLPDTKIHDLIQSAYEYDSYYVMSEGLNPHTHYIAKGRETLETNGTSNFDPNYPYTGTDSIVIIKDQEPDINREQLGFFRGIDANPKNYRLTAEQITSGYKAVTSDYKSSPVDYATYAQLNSDPQLNYVLQSVQGSVGSLKIYNNFNATAAGTEYYIDDNFIWYGRTSEPVWATEATSSSSKHRCSAGYFRPESVKVLPLIKL